MDRRPAGIVLLLVGVLAVAVLPSLSGRGVVGTAQRVSVPMVGECVLVGESVDPGSAGGSVAGSSSEVDEGPMAQLTGILGDCADPAAARVIASRPESLLASASAADYSSARAALCSAAVEAARGRVAPASGFVWQRRDVLIGVRPQVQLEAELAVSPDTIGGPQWTACYASDAAGQPIPVLSADGPIDALGSCFRDAADGAPSPVSCSLPHSSQLLGTAAQIAGFPTTKDYRLACRDFAALALGVSDPTVGAALRLDTIDGTSGDGTPGDCRISVADRRRMLSGSVVGLDRRPLPWSG